MVKASPSALTRVPKMPSPQEIDLFVNSLEGGSGHPDSDALLTKRLKRILDVPDKQVDAYIKTRDRGTVHKLDRVVREMPSIDGSEIGASPPRGASGLSRSQSSSPARSKRRDRNKARLEELSTMRTTNDGFFSSNGPSAMATPGQAFDGVVKMGYRPHLDSWRQNSSEREVKVFADACRAIRYLGTSVQGRDATSHHQHFPWYPEVKDWQPSDKKNSRNISNVPLGSLYAQSAAEAKAGLVRKAMHDHEVAVARKREEDILAGAATKPGGQMSYPLQSFKDNKSLRQTDAAIKVGEDQGVPAPSAAWRSFARATWNPDVHAQRETEKHGNSHRIGKLGEAARLQKSQSETLARVSQSSGEGGGSMFDISNPKPASRFSFAKFS